MENDDRSVIRNLLRELSWEGKSIRNYRNGGIGYENVLTAEVFQILDFLPREHFLGSIIDELNVDNDDLKTKIKKEIEKGVFTLLPGNFYLKPSGDSHQTKHAVQPDGILEFDSVYTVIEAKRIRHNSFQEKQLAREFVLATKEARDKSPLLLLILGQEPPVLVKGKGRLSIEDSIVSPLEEIVLNTEGHPLAMEEIKELIKHHTAWITWQKIQEIIIKQLESYCELDLPISNKNSVTRLCNSLLESIEVHG
jgi:hypothetical protein